MIDSWCRILGNELLHVMLIADDDDVVPLVEQRIHCCRYYAEEEEEVAYVAGVERMNELYFVHDIDVALVRATFVVAAIGYCRRTLQSSYHPQHNILFDVVGIDDYIAAAADAVSL